MAINVLCFLVFALGGRQLISRSWLMDLAITPQTTVAAKSDTPSEPWNGEFYCSFGDDHSRDWNEARDHGFVCSGGAWHSYTLKILAPKDRLWFNVPGSGYVSVGRALGHAVPERAFSLLLDGATRRYCRCSRPTATANMSMTLNGASNSCPYMGRTMSRWNRR